MATLPYRQPGYGLDLKEGYKLKFLNVRGVFQFLLVVFETVVEEAFTFSIPSELGANM